MRRIILVGLMLLGGVHLSIAQQLRAYRIYNKKGNPISFAQMIHRITKKYDVVLFGEYHNNAIVHWLELKTAEALYKKEGQALVLGAEMFERDNQKAVNAYLSGRINLEEFEKTSRMWPNFETDYEPLLNFAKVRHLQFIATNIPRRYAQFVAKQGLDTLAHLTAKDRSYMMHLPLKVSMKTPGYREMKKMMTQHAGDRWMNFVDAQAVKDATMAESIYKHWKKGSVFLHFNGNYHSKEYGGIYWYLIKEKKFLQRLRIAVITLASSKNQKLPLPEKGKRTEFTLVVPADMTKTY